MIFKSDDGSLLYCESFRVENPKASLLVVHGIGEHLGRYQEFARVMNRSRIDVHCLDLRGHGRSNGIRGHVQSFLQYHQDLEAWVSHLQGNEELSTEIPCFLFGHSLGGLICTGFLARRKPEPLSVPIVGLALSNPAFGIAMNPLRKMEKELAKRLPSFLRHVQVPNSIPAEKLSHDKKAVEAYKQDPLVHSWATPALYLAMLEEMRALKKLLPQLKMPLLFLLSGKDTIVHTAAAERFAKKLTVAYPENIRIRHFHGFFHEIFQETKRERAYLELKKWIQECLHPRKKIAKKKGSSTSSARAAIVKGISL